MVIVYYLNFHFNLLQVLFILTRLTFIPQIVLVLKTFAIEFVGVLLKM